MGRGRPEERGDRPAEPVGTGRHRAAAAHHRPGTARAAPGGAHHDRGGGTVRGATGGARRAVQGSRPDPCRTGATVDRPDHRGGRGDPVLRRGADPVGRPRLRGEPRSPVALLQPDGTDLPELLWRAGGRGEPAHRSAGDLRHHRSRTAPVPVALPATGRRGTGVLRLGDARRAGRHPYRTARDRWRPARRARRAGRGPDPVDGAAGAARPLGTAARWPTGTARSRQPGGAGQAAGPGRRAALRRRSALPVGRVGIRDAAVPVRRGGRRHAHRRR